MKKIAAIIAILFALCSFSASAQMPGADFKPTDEQIKSMMDIDNAIVMLIAQAPGNFETLKGAAMGTTDGMPYYGVTSPNPAMKPAIVELIIEKKKAMYYAAVFNTQETTDFYFAAFMMLPHYGKNDGTFTIEEEKAEKGSQEKYYYLLMKGTKVGFYKYTAGPKVGGVLSVGMY